MLPKDTQELEALLGHLMAEQKNVESLRRSMEKERDESKQRNVELENRLRQVEKERRKVVQETRDQVVREAAQLQRKVREAAAELRKEKSRQRIEQAKKALAEVQEQLNAEVWRARAVVETDEKEAEAGSIAAGDTVWLKEAGLQATVLSVSEERGLVEVHAGSAKITLSLDSVEKRIPTTNAVEPEVALITRGLSKRTVPLELDLRGKRADEVELALEGYLNEASLGNLSQVRIIHGIGTGTVRQIVREILDSHPLVMSFRVGGQGEGGDGSTVVSLWPQYSVKRGA
jgi:DNA mismatch repair protein MutS2